MNLQSFLTHVVLLLLLASCLISNSGEVSSGGSSITITEVSPTTGDLRGGTALTIVGTGFKPGAIVAVGGVDCAPVTFISSESLQCVTGSGNEGSVDILVTNPIDLFSLGQVSRATLSNGFIYSNSSNGSGAAPTVTSISPAIGDYTGGTSVTIYGTGFLTGATVRIGTANCSSVAVTPTTALICTTGPTAAGLYDVVVTNTDGRSGTLSSGFTYLGPIVSSWTFIDGNGANGINKVAARLAAQPSFTTFNSKLYATWHESDGTAYQVRILRHNASVDSPSWTFVDGNAATGINKSNVRHGSSANLTVFNSKLYAGWTEVNGSNVYQARVAVYNGDDSAPIWTFVDGNAATGINKDTNLDALLSKLTVFNSKLYATWQEDSKIRVVVYNGNDSSPSWSFVDGNNGNGINKNPLYAANSPQLTVLNSKLYANWHENTAGAVLQARFAVYNGNDSSPTWSFIDGNGANGLNKNTGENAQQTKLTVFNSKLYASWNEESVGANFYQTRVRVYNGNDSSPVWSFVDGNGATGLNYNTMQGAQAPYFTVSNMRLYGAWQETNGTASQIRMVVYNGNDSDPRWSFVDGNSTNGINKNTSSYAYSPMMLDFTSKLFVTWEELNAGLVQQIRMAVGQ